MSNLMKMPHEISLWDDILTVVDDDGNEYSGFVDISKISVAAQYYKEKKLCVISSDKLESPTYVVEPALTRKTDGTSTLTFSIYAKYWDEESGKLVDNPFVQYLTNERKVKLKYFPNGELKWLDFIIKKIDESSENYKFTYTATSLFINELSKSGYNLEFDMELENNQGPVDELANKVLTGTDWVVGADSELLQQTTTEALYRVKLTEDIQAYNIFTDELKNIPANENIYTFYSTLTNKTYDYFQFLYDSNNKYTVDENGVLYGAGSYYIDLTNNSLPFNEEEVEYVNDYRGERYVRSPKVVYDKILERYVNVYNNDQVYGYTESKYISPALVSNLITNGASIITNAGWLQQQAIEPETQMYPTYDQDSSYTGAHEFGLKYKQDADNSFIMNTGFKDNIDKIGSVAESDRFVFRIKGGTPNWSKENGFSLNTISFNVELAAYEFGKGGEIKKGEAIFSGLASAEDTDGYRYIDNLRPARAISKEELIDVSTKRFGIFISNPNDGEYYIQKVELFAYVEDKEGRVMLPDGRLMDITDTKIVPEAYVDTTYYYYNKPDETITDPSQIKYLYIGKRALDDYRPTYVANFEKVRGITAKETNRFNLLQSLSEAFEGWCRFDVLHKENGEIALGRDVAQTYINSGDIDTEATHFYTAGTPLTKETMFIVANGVQTTADAYRQQKFVTFHKRIGQKKSIGFTYGINLKSIGRSLDSNDIATKLIVKSNNNKYANMGSCNIARASVNPNGQNFILDFSHYVKQGLLDYKNVQNDLYSREQDRGWIGLYWQLDEKAKERDALITKQSALVAELSKHKSDYESSRLLCDSLDERYREQTEYYHSYTGYKYGDIEKKLADTENPVSEKDREELIAWRDDEKTTSIVADIARLRAEKEKQSNIKTGSKGSLDTIEAELEDISSKLTEIGEETSALINKFEKKYSRFLQEASWISENHTDDNLYYFDAETTLHNAAQPKVTYTVNIVELSQLEGYEGYNFDIGDITYVKDPDFFGDTKEEIVITEMITYFNSPEKNVIKAKNYRDSFEDLFQRMAASSQQLQFYSGAYDRAADAVSPDGNIMPQALSDAFAHNAYVLSNIANQSVRWDEYGITTTDTTDPNDIVRITSGGIYLTEDGGRNWTTGISASGINAKTITTGQLDTGAVTIMSGNQTAFRWDDSGINAYKDEDGKRSSKTYVRFDEHGLYGIDGQASFNPDKENENGKTGIEKINEEAKFALTWDGFVLNSSDKSDNTAQVKISDTEDIQIIDKSGVELVKIGRLDGENSAGMRVSVDQANSVVIGDTGLVDTSSGKHGKLVFRAGPVATVDENGDLVDDAPFRVYEDGFFYAKTGQIGGALTEARLRDIRLDASYVTKTNGSSVILTCEPTINGDELSNIRWSVNEIEYSNGNNKLSIELTYDELANFRNEENAYGISVKADIGEGEELESFTDTMSLLPDNIFKLVTEYVIGNNGTDIPGNDADWSRDMPTNIAPGSYLWTRFGNVFLDGTATYRYEVTYQGKDGSGQFTSIVFKRTTTNITPDTPSGGNYSDPIPEGWSDGILADGGPYVWSSQAVFRPDGTEPTWSTPVLMRDVSGKFDVQYSNETEQPANPTDAPEKWYDASLTGADLTNAIWMATRSSEDGGANWSVWTITRIKGEDGVAAQDLNLKADSYVFVQNKDGNITPSQINLTATAYNLSGGVIAWSGVEQEDIDGVTNTATLSYNANDYVNGSGHTVSVTYTDIETGQVTFTDSITILLVKDGSDAISASLTNPTMTFAEGAISTETTGAIVYYGSTPINYATSGNTGWRYTIACEGAASIKNGIVSIDNPGETTTFEAIIVVYKDGSIYRTQTLVINCLVTESPYTIELSNDNATIGIDENGAYDGGSLKLVTQTNVTVHKGITDITGECTFIWSAQGGILSSNSGTSNFFTGLLAGQTTAIATVYVKYGDTIIGTKTLKVATVEAGAAVSYKLNVAPNTVNLTSVEEATISLEVLKIVGGSVETLDSGYVIYVNGIKKGLITSSDISADTTFELYIGNNKWDSETVSVVKDGADGRSIGEITEKYGVTTTSETPPKQWKNSVSELDFNETNKYLWNQEIVPYSDGTSQTFENIIAVYGDTGRGIQDITNYYLATNLASGVTTTTSGWTETIQSVSSSKKYLWNYEVITYTSGSSTTTVPCIIGAYGDPGAAAQDLNLTADSYVFVKDKDGIITPSSITFTANASNLSGGSFKWYKDGTLVKSGSAATYSLTKSAFGSATSSTITVEYSGTTFTDSIKVLLVQDGSDGSDGEPAISVALTNPNMTFNTANSTAKETSEAIIYYGTTPINYGSSNAVDGWYYTISEAHDKVSVNSLTGVITVTNPLSDVSIPITLKLHRGSTSNVSEHTLYINCSVVKNGEPGDKGDTGDDGVPGAKTEAVRIYYKTNDTSPDSPETTIVTYNTFDRWTTHKVSPDFTRPYVFSCTGTKTTTYSSSTDTTGTTVYNNDWTESELYLAYNSFGIDYVQYAEYLKLTNYETEDALSYLSTTDENGETKAHLYINATYINSGVLKAGDVFSAAVKTGEVYLAGWTASASSAGLVYGTLGSSGSMCLYPKGQYYSGTIAKGTGKTWVMGVGANFGVTTNGDLYCSTANLGDFTVNSRKIKFNVTEVSSTVENIPSMEMYYNYFGGATIYHTKYYPSVFGLQYSSFTNKVFNYADEVSLTPSFLEFHRYTTRPSDVDDISATRRYLTISTEWGSGASTDRLILGNSLCILPYLKVATLETTNYRLYATPSTFSFMYNSNNTWLSAGYFSTYNTGYVNIVGTFKTNGSNWISSSDQKVKKDIQNFTDNYELLFDNLIPRLYRFKDGTSGRLHSGYIVQEVLEALAKSSISTQDFAAVCAFGDQNDESTEWGFRYEELISLNTWQIQKLKPRITAAEQEIETLKSEIQQLRTELEALK